MKKPVSIVLLATMLLQSCVVYQKNPVPLSEALDKDKVKVITNTNEKLKFKKVIQKDSIYYGVNNKKLKNDYGAYEWTEITYQLMDSEIESIFLKDKSRSVWATVGLIPAAIVASVSLVVLFWVIIGPTT